MILPPTPYSSHTHTPLPDWWSVSAGQSAVCRPKQLAAARPWFARRAARAARLLPRGGQRFGPRGGGPNNPEPFPTRIRAVECPACRVREAAPAASQALRVGGLLFSVLAVFSASLPGRAPSSASLPRTPRPPGFHAMVGEPLSPSRLQAGGRARRRDLSPRVGSRLGAVWQPLLLRCPHRVRDAMLVWCLHSECCGDAALASWHLCCQVCLAPPQDRGVPQSRASGSGSLKWPTLAA